VVEDGVRKAAGIAFLLFLGLSAFLEVAYLVLATEFALPPGPPLVLLGLVALALATVVRLARRQP
jgi:hypothetical protein